MSITNKLIKKQRKSSLKFYLQDYKKRY